MTLNSRFDVISSKCKKTYEDDINFSEYLNLLFKDPGISRNAYQNIYEAIKNENINKKVIKHFYSESFGYTNNRRNLHLRGKLDLIKRCLENYSIYTFKWVALPPSLFPTPNDKSQLNEDPLKLIPIPLRQELISDLNSLRNSEYKIDVVGELDHRSNFFMNELLIQHSGSWEKVVKSHIRVFKLSYSEINRVGISHYTHNSEPIGNTDWAKLQIYGVESDPRTFKFDGELCCCNRGVAFLSGVPDDLFIRHREVKPDRFPKLSIDCAIISHSTSQMGKKDLVVEL